MRRLLLLAAAVVALAGGWYIGSPWLAMRSLQDAATSLDRPELEERIDFASVRDSLKPQVRSYLRQEFERQEGRGLIESFGRALVLANSDRAIDAFVTPEGMATLVTSGGIALPLLPKGVVRQDIEWSVKRDGMNRFHAVGALEGGRDIILVFERDGLSWNLAGVELPLDQP